MSTSETDELILKAVVDHYREQDSPFYLADLGQFLQFRKIVIPDGSRLKDYLAANFQGRLVVIQDPETPARIAVATPDNLERVRRRLSKRSLSQRDDRGIAFERLPNSLVAAFCKIPPPNTDVYFRVVPPFRYDTFVYQPDHGYTLIGPEHRPSEFAGRTAAALTDNERRTIFGFIVNWAEANSIDLQSLYYDHPRRLKQTQEVRNALQRLIDAQDTDFRTRMKIPGDIAAILMGRN